MPKFNVEATFSLVTTIEPSFYGHSFDNNEVEDFRDNSYWNGEEVRADGGVLMFTVEADSEDEAERLAEDVISSGHEIEDGDGLTWGAEDVEFSIERVEEELTPALAIERIREFISSADIPLDTREAIDLLLGLIQPADSGAGDWVLRNA